ncbi:MAG: aldo/keto reductase [Streptosporangiales bacterium]
MNRSDLSLGTMSFGSKLDQRAAADVVRHCLDAGVTAFDTANIYNGGEAERVLGAVVGPVRDRVRIATKVGSPDGPETERGQAPLSPCAVRAAIDGSLRRLGTDYVDLYYLHRPDYATPIVDTLGVLDELVQEGKVRSLGDSNFAAWQACEIQLLARQHDWRPVGTSQQMYNMLARRLEDEYLPFARQYGVSTLVYNPLAGGLLSGRHRQGQEPDPGSRFAGSLYRQRYWNDTQLDAVAGLQRIASDAGMSLVEMSMRWLRSRTGVDGIVLGASSLGQLEENLAAADRGPLDTDVLQRIDDVTGALHGVAPSYNR